MASLPWPLPDADAMRHIGTVHRRRLRAIWRSAGWPCQDLVEVELLDAGLVERRIDAAGRDTLRVTDAGVHLLAATLAHHRAARDAHESLVAHVALHMQRAGRVVWRGLSLRAWVDAAPPDETAAAAVRIDLPAQPPDGRWAIAMPDVYSIRHTTVEPYLQAAVHEVKVSRADLLSDLRHPAKGAAYRALAGECWYVLKAGIADVEEIPDTYGVIWAHGTASGIRLELGRPAPQRPHRMPFALWMALARAAPEPAPDEDAQAGLAAADQEEGKPGAHRANGYD